MDYASLSGPELAKAFNAMAELVGRHKINKFKDRATGIRRCQEMAKIVADAKPTKPETVKKTTRFEERIAGTFIVGVAANSRREGTAAHGHYEAMKKFVDKSGGRASLADVLKNTSYRRQDFDWDQKRGHITVSKE